MFSKDEVRGLYPRGIADRDRRRMTMDLDDFAKQQPADGQVARWDAARHLWVPVALADAIADVVPPPQFLRDAISNGTATTPTAYGTHNAIAVAAVPLRMIVQVLGNWGFNGAVNTSQASIVDEGGVTISDGVTNSNQTTAGWKAIAMAGSKDYTAGATMGYRVQYAVDTSNIYIDHRTVVTFHPL